jgi:hypothetical protein
MTESAITLSTKCWEGDYRTVLTPEALGSLFAPFGKAHRKQVVLNRIADRSVAEARAAQLIAAGHIDAYAWAEDAWPEVADRLAIPVTWFGAAWPYSAPELCELHLAPPGLVLHLAGDVRLSEGPPWLPGAAAALRSLPDVRIVSPLSPSGQESRTAKRRQLDEHWVATQDFSDQCFLVDIRSLDLPTLVRSTHPACGGYPRPGGSLTFEARTSAWLRRTGGWRATDLDRSYLHPVTGAEGDSYAAAAATPSLLPPLTAAGPHYPTPGSVPVTGVIIVRNQERSIGAAVSSLSWCERVVVFDQQSEDRTAEVARAAGADVRSTEVTGTADPARRAALEAVGADWVFLLDGDELVPGPLAHAIAAAAARPDVGGVRCPRRNYLFGQWARGAGWWPDHQLRAFRPDVAVLPAGVHGSITLLPGHECETLPARADLAIVHFNYADLGDWLERTNRYTAMQAQGKVFDRNVSMRAAVREFLTRLVRDGGWRLGRRGWRLSLLGALYTWVYVEKAVEDAAGGATAIRAEYDDLAAETLAPSQRGGRRRNG